MKSPKSLPKLKNRNLRVRRVVGDSMNPTLQSGQLVLVRATTAVKVGDIVMIRHDKTEKIKRIARTTPGRVYVLGDNPNASTDSRTFGWLGAETVVGKVVWPRTQREV